MKCYRDLFKKKKINAMNNKMAINTYLPIIESKKQTKQTRRTETESWIQRAFLWLPDERGVCGSG